MKANHNIVSAPNKLYVVVVNISSSKNESKSQHNEDYPEDLVGCCKYQ
nr:hypothetical protein [Pedobacter puniceum]